MVAGRIGDCDHQLKLVGKLFFRYGQQVLLFNGGALIVLVEVQDEGKQIKGFPANVRDGP